TPPRLPWRRSSMTHLKPSASELQPDGPVRIAPLPASVQTARDWIGEPMESTGRLCLQLEDNDKEPQINRQEVSLQHVLPPGCSQFPDQNSSITHN
ncbi:hypothetical protein GOODEAATRI_032945, partial [Goodea atripinnis]